MISVVIPTYNNTKQLLENLKNNLAFLKENEIIVVNDYPTQNIAEELKNFPGIKLIANKQNLGFADTMHTGILKTSNRYVMLLNDDVLLQDTSFANAATSLQKDQTVFAISFGQKEKDGSLVGKNTFYWKNGFFQHSKANNVRPGINGWAEGGACLIDKEKYIKIGGFDNLYSPFYWEDIDLSYRAWKTGYQVLFDPSIVVVHHHESTIGKQFGKGKIKEIAYRNQFIFIWKNMTNHKLLLSHKLKTLIMLPYMIFKDAAFVFGFWKALLKLPNILQHRFKGVLSDEEILKKFK